MDDMEQKLGQILSNPQMMGQIMAMAQNLSQAAPQPQRGGSQNPAQNPVQNQHQNPPQQAGPAPVSLPEGLNLAAIQNIAGIVGKTGVDSNQRALLRALNPYLGQERIAKLEKAMRAAKIAGFASSILTGGFTNQSGR